MNRRDFLGTAAASLGVPLLKGVAMTAPQLESDDRQEAAALAFAVLRFASGGVPPSPLPQQKGLPRLGDEAYRFIPGPRAIPNAEVPKYLASLSSPAILIPTAAHGSVALILVDELTGERQAQMRKELANQQSGLDMAVQQHGLQPDSRVLLEFDQESHIYRLAAVRVWLQRFLITVGWNMPQLKNDARATARLVLFRHDGMMSTGKRFGGQH
jgi:hypothetical protein